MRGPIDGASGPATASSPSAGSGLRQPRRCHPAVAPDGSVAARDASATPRRGAEVAELGNTLARWRAEILTRHDTGASDGPTEGLNLCVKKVKRCGHAFRTFEHYRLRVLLHAGDCDVGQPAPVHRVSEPVFAAQTRRARIRAPTSGVRTTPGALPLAIHAHQGASLSATRPTVRAKRRSHRIVNFRTVPRYRLTSTCVA